MSVLNACLILVLFTLTLSGSRYVLSEEIPKCQDSNNTVESCCPCFQETLTNCSVTCPDDYFSINVTASFVNCETNSSSTPNVSMTTTTMTSVSTETENSTMVPENTTKSAFSIDKMYVITCLKSCPENRWYDNVTMQCLKCDDKCLKCKWPDRDVCTVCNFQFNETCYAECPKGTVYSKTKTKNGSKSCEKSEDTGDDNLVVIIAASAGGGAVVLIGVVFAVCCCCCHRRRQANIRGDQANSRRTAMSVLIEDKQQTGGGKETNKKPGGRPVGYENVSNTLPTGTEIQRHGDNVLRYTKDPTIKEKIKEKEDETDEESPYGNMAMVRLAKKTDLTHAKGENLHEMLELEEMEEAPQAPKVPQVPVDPVALPVSTAKKKRTEKSKPVPEHVPEDYVDMSAGPKVPKTANKPRTTHTDMDPASSLKSYETVKLDDIPQGRKAAKKPPDDDLELYENVPGAKSETAKGDNSDLEDYENTKELHKGKDKPDEDDNKDLEDYENMKDLDLELYENTQFS